MPSPRQLEQMVAQAKARFVKDCAAVLLEIGDHATLLARTLGEISHDEAINSLRQVAIEAIERIR